MKHLTESQQKEICQSALQAGFSAAVFTSDIETCAGYRQFYQQYLNDGYHASLQYLENTLARFDIDQVYPGCQSMLVLAHPYLHQQALAELKSAPYKIARYAWGRDYHATLKAALKGIMREHQLEGRPVVDSTPLPERYFARRAGLGKIGKNGLLIIEGQGSFHLLAFLLLPYMLEQKTISQAGTNLQADLDEICGSCRRCIDACPTTAILPGGKIDTGRCISYLTIENKDSDIPRVKGKAHRWIFGCDICQTVCPHNDRRVFTLAGDFAPRASTVDVARGEIAAEEGQLAGSPLKRAGQKGLKRNIDYVNRQAVSVIKQSNHHE